MRRRWPGVLQPVLLIVMLCTPFRLEALETTPDPKAEQAAKEDLEDLKQFVREAAEAGGPNLTQLLEMLGVESLEEVSALQLSEPMREFRVDFAGLKSFDPRKNKPLDLLKDTNKVTFPLKLGKDERGKDKLRSLLTVRKSEDGKEWKPGAWGSPQFANNLSRFIKTSHFMVWIPELNLFYLGAIVAGELNLTSIGDVPQQDLIAGTAKSAAVVFSRLKPEANARKKGIR